MANYAYPIDPSWSVTEMDTVIRFLNTIEAAYETGVAKDKILTSYKAFKRVIPSKMEEKQIGRAFAKVSGYEIYPTVKLAQESDKKTIHMSVK